jgi:peroxiredoxin
MRRLVCAIVALTLISVAARAAAPATQPASIRLTGIDGRSYEPLTVSGHRAAVMVFVLQDCPICNGYAPQIQRLASRFVPKGAAFYLIHVDPTLTIEAARKHAADYGYSIPVMIDSGHELVRRLGVVAVPTAVVLGSDGQIKYEGRIDDQYVSIGKARDVVTRYDLRDAIAATIEGKPVEESRAQAIGCAVPDLPEKK